MSHRNTRLDQNTRDGLRICGQVVSRTVSQIPNTDIRKVVYTIATPNGLTYVQRNLPHDVTAVASQIDWPVEVNVYSRKSGQVAWNLRYSEQPIDIGDEAIAKFAALVVPA